VTTAVGVHDDQAAVEVVSVAGVLVEFVIKRRVIGVVTAKGSVTTGEIVGVVRHARVVGVVITGDGEIEMEKLRWRN
jgi:hypothetical protein